MEKSTSHTSSMKSQSVERQKNKITRAISLDLKRKVWKRDGGRCQYQDPKTGKRCESQHQLELDYVRKSFAGKPLDSLSIMPISA